VARAREIPGLECDESFALAAARVVEVRAGEVLEHSHAVLDLSDPEQVHAMRVATRRLRAAMEIFAPCFPRKTHRKALKEVKAIADALGERRDRDVAIESLERYAAGVGAADRDGVELLLVALRREQESANDALVPFVAEERLAALRGRVDEMVEDTRRGAETGGVSV
jgi:CHAD domain-containing protein